MTHFEPKPLFSNDEPINNSSNEPKILNIEEHKNIGSFEPKGLIFDEEIMPIIKKEQNEKNFLYSYGYLASKLPSIKKDYYNELTPILTKVNRENKEMQDNDISEIGKNLQKEIGDFTRDYVGNSSISQLINEIVIAHKDIVKEINEKSNLSKGFFMAIKDKLQNKTQNEQNNEVFINTLNKFVYNNNEFKLNLMKALDKFEYIDNMCATLTQKIEFYLDFLTFFENDLNREGFDCNINLIRSRKENILTSSVMFATTKMILKTQKDKIYLLSDNIDNVVNILIPTYISKLKISELGDTSLNELAETIVQKLNIERI